VRLDTLIFETRRLFHTEGPTTENARAWVVEVRAKGTKSNLCSNERSELRPLVPEVGQQRSRRQAGARPRIQWRIEHKCSPFMGCPGFVLRGRCSYPAGPWSLVGFPIVCNWMCHDMLVHCLLLCCKCSFWLTIKQTGWLMEMGLIRVLVDWAPNGITIK